MMRYKDHVYSKTVRHILKEVFPKAEPLGAALISNTRESSNKIMVVMERENHEKLKNAHIV